MRDDIQVYHKQQPENNTSNHNRKKSENLRSEKEEGGKIFFFRVRNVVRSCGCVEGGETKKKLIW